MKNKDDMIENRRIGLKKEELSIDRKIYLKNLKKKKYTILFFQIFVLVGFLSLWEIAATQGFIDEFITSKPSRILDTFMNLTSNDLLKHIAVTSYETIVGFLLGTTIGTIVAIILWWSDYLSKIFEPYLVVLNSLPKVALRTHNYYMGWCWYTGYNCYGSCNFFNCNHFRKFKWLFRNR